MTTLPRELARRALRHLVRTLPAERAMVLVEDEGKLTPAAAEGVDTDQAWSGELSMSLLETVLQEGAPVLLCDALEDSVYGDHSSVVLARIRSVLCVPFRGASGRIAGLLYADNRRKDAAFGYRHLEGTTRFVRELERELTGKRRQPEVPQQVRDPPPEPQRRRAVVPRPRQPELEPAADGHARRRPSGRASVVFFRSLGTLLSAGVFIDRALLLLARQSDEPAMANVCWNLTGRVRAGERLSRAMASFPKIFTPLQIGLIEVGEESGRIDSIVARLAGYEEARHALAMRLKSALTYPAFLFLIALASLLLVPPFLLQGHFQLIRDAGVEPPLLTVAVMSLSDLARNPLAQAAVLLAGILALLKAPRFLACPDVRLWIAARLLALPMVGRLARLGVTTNFARALALLLDAGRDLLGSLELAARATGHPILQRLTPAILERLRDGQDLATSLSASRFFPVNFLEMLRAGEEAGEIPQMCTRTANMYELELQSLLDAVISLLEPVFLMLLGIVVAILVLATMLPIVELFGNV
ncbi:MAG: type II secretion system F family protein [Armatimonadetes bacterium]|nr:type II secretion system F family protein [Armatimonadota bacterium]